MWRWFEESVWDSDLESDDRLSSTHTRSLPSSDTVSRTGVSFSDYSSHVVINYSFKRILCYVSCTSATILYMCMNFVISLLSAIS